MKRSDLSGDLWISLILRVSHSVQNPLIISASPSELVTGTLGKKRVAMLPASVILAPFSGQVLRDLTFQFVPLKNHLWQKWCSAERNFLKQGSLTWTFLAVHQTESLSDNRLETTLYSLVGGNVWIFWFRFSLLAYSFLKLPVLLVPSNSFWNICLGQSCQEKSHSYAAICL